MNKVNDGSKIASYEDRMSQSAGLASYSRSEARGLIDERALVEQCRRQDYEAFGRVVDAYQSRIYGFVKRMVRNDEEALDVTQEVFIKAFQGMASFDGRASLRSWLFRIAYNLCVDRSRRAKRSPKTFSYEPSDEGDEPMEFSDQRWDPEESVLGTNFTVSLTKRWIR